MAGKSNEILRNCTTYCFLFLFFIIFLAIIIPGNPFAKKVSLQEIQIGEPASVGDISYIPFKTDGTIDKYTLIGYGNIRKPLDLNQDGLADNVLIICEADGISVSEEHHFSKLRRMKEYKEKAQCQR